MRGKFAVVFTCIFVLIFLSTACTSSFNVPVETPSPSETAVPTPTPVPITKDIPSFFMPGLTEVGVLPTKAYKIGIIIDESKEESGYQELLQISKEYADRFDVEILLESGTNTQKQLTDATNMISSGIDFLIISPFKNEKLTQISDLCEQEGIPYITMNNRLGKTPGENGYVCAIVQDDYLMGVLTGISIVDTMVRQNGAFRGNIAEITGKIQDESTQLRSMGIRRVLSDFEGINIVCCVAGDDEADTSYKAAVNVLKAFRQDELDGIITLSDEAGLQTLQAVLDFDRDELVGKIYSMGGTKAGLTGVWYGSFAQTIEDTHQSGMFALEYALQYLEGAGDDIPPVITQVTRVFRADTEEQKEDIAKIIADLSGINSDTCLDNMGSYEMFLPDMKMQGIHYPKPYYAYPDVDAFLLEYEPFTTGEAYYNQAE